MLSRSESRRDGKYSVQTANGQRNESLTRYEGEGKVTATATAFDGTFQTDESENGLGK